MAVSVWYHDGELHDFQVTFFTLCLVGFLLVVLSRNKVASLRRRDGVLIVAFFWLYLSLVSTIPLMLGDHLSLVDALFEATSGMTTTGATVISDLSRIEPSILYYRQQLQWIGGMGLIVLAIAVLPMLGVGGAQLYRGETPGPASVTDGPQPVADIRIDNRRLRGRVLGGGHDTPGSAGTQLFDGFHRWLFHPQ